MLKFKICQQTRDLLSVRGLTKIISTSIIFIMLLYLSWRKYRNTYRLFFFLSMDLFRAGLNLANF